MDRRRFLQRTGVWAAGTAWAARLGSHPTAWAVEAPARASTAGPLRHSSQNGRYFVDAAGRAVFLTGAHTWNNLSDIGPGNPPPAFDFSAYLDFLDRHHHNFIRLWRWELTRWDAASTQQYTTQKDMYFVAPHPWKRSGDRLALDGLPQFDLEQFDPAYFERLRRRVQAAQRRGIYVGIMLFEGWGLQHLPDAWQSHPFHPANNVQGLDGNAGGDGRGLMTYTLKLPEVTRFQQAYVRHLIDAVNDLDNVLYEITNESGAYSIEWQYHWIRFIKEYQRTKPQQHPVGMTFPYSRDKQQRGTNAQLFESPADWISPNPDAPDGYNYRTNPPPADGSKVIISDTDHLWGIGGNPDWVWKSFLRGHNPIFMDPYDNRVLGKADPESWDGIREALGHTRRLAERLELAAMTPRGDLASTGYCLANPGHQYVIYLPDGGRVEVDLTAAAGAMTVEWMDPLSGIVHTADPVAGGAKRALQPPRDGASVLYLRKQT